MEWLANLIALGFAIATLAGVLRMVADAARDSADPVIPRAKRGFLLAFAAIFVLFGAMLAIYLAFEPRGYMVAGMVSIGVFLAGLVPICHVMVLSQIRFMGMQGEGPVVLSAESRRALKLPLVGGNLLGVLGATAMIWLGARTPPLVDPEYLFILALALCYAGVAWPLFVLKHRVAKDRAPAAAAHGRD